MYPVTIQQPALITQRKSTHAVSLSYCEMAGPEDAFLCGISFEQSNHFCSMLFKPTVSLRLRNHERLLLMLLNYDNVHAILPVTINGKFCNLTVLCQMSVQDDRNKLVAKTRRNASDVVNMSLFLSCLTAKLAEIQ